jgi:hypothetical protein
LDTDDDSNSEDDQDKDFFNDSAKENKLPNINGAKSTATKKRKTPFIIDITGSECDEEA